MGNCASTEATTARADPPTAAAPAKSKDVLLSVTASTRASSTEMPARETRPSTRRSTMMRNKRVIIQAEYDDDEIDLAASSDKEFTLMSVAKEPQTEALIRAALAGNLVFTALSEEQIALIVGAMTLVNVAVGERVCVEQEKGDFFYVIETGTFDVEVEKKKVMAYAAGGSFGELALLFNCPRKATVTCTSEALCWKLDRKTFRHYLAHSTHKEQQERVLELKAVALFSSLSNEQLAAMAKAIQIESYVKEGAAPAPATPARCSVLLLLLPARRGPPTSPTRLHSLSHRSPLSSGTWRATRWSRRVL